MNIDTKKTEELIKKYLKEPVKENLIPLMDQVQRTVYCVPAMLPNTPEVQEMKKAAKENPNQQLKMPEGVVPVPALIRNAEGATYVPIYTNANEIPKEPKFDMVMTMPFQSCYTLALNEQVGAEGISINPFSKDMHLLIKKEMLQMIQQKAAEQASAAKQIRLTPRQYGIMMRQKAEFQDFPYLAYKGGAEFINRLSDEKESVVNSIYQKAYQQPKLYPYSESDFSVMALNISEDLLLVRVDLPDVKEKAQMCYRIYITLQEKDNKIHYFTIERGKENDERNLGGIASDGKHIEYGEAPVEGAELQRIMDIIAQEKEQTS